MKGIDASNLFFIGPCFCRSCNRISLQGIAKNKYIKSTADGLVLNIDLNDLPRGFLKDSQKLCSQCGTLTSLVSDDVDVLKKLSAAKLLDQNNLLNIVMDGIGTFIEKEIQKERAITDELTNLCINYALSTYKPKFPMDDNWYFELTNAFIWVCYLDVVREEMLKGNMGIIK